MKILTTFFLGMLLLCTACQKETPDLRVHRIMTERMVTLATAESCTGGAISARFTAMPGASAYFKYGIVTYCNEAKCKIFDICHDSIARYGVVSEPIVRKMAEGARRVANADYAIATTGIAGPSGGTTEQPVGTVWIAVASPARTTSRLIFAKGDRNAIIQEAGTAAIELLEEELQQK